MYDRWLVHGSGLGLLLLENFHLQENKATAAGPGVAGCNAVAKLCHLCIEHTDSGFCDRAWRLSSSKIMSYSSGIFGIFSRAGLIGGFVSSSPELP